MSSLGSSGEQAIAVVYYRSGYSPDDYHSDNVSVPFFNSSGITK